MRRTASSALSRAALLTLPFVVSGCVGFGTFLDHTFTVPGENPNLPMRDSENVRRVLGQPLDQQPLTPEPGNVWPAAERPDPTLQDLQNPGAEDRRGFPPTETGGEPGLPAGRQPRPRGSSTPPGDAAPPTPGTPAAGIPPVPRPRNPPPVQSPLGGIVQTPQGPAVDAGGTNSYRQLTTPQGPGAIMVPNGNGTSTIINPNGTVQTVPSPR